jgi:hypothetical protein
VKHFRVFVRRFNHQGRGVVDILGEFAQQVTGKQVGGMVDPAREIIPAPVGGDAVRMEQQQVRVPPRDAG